MKSAYEKRCKYGINAMLFGQPRKAYGKLYWFLLALIISLGILIDKGVF